MSALSQPTFPSGTTLPTSPATDDYFFLKGPGKGILCWYDGTRWLGPPYELVWLIRATALQPFPGNDWVYQAAQHDAFACYLDRFDINTYVVGTNNGTNYWTIDLNDASNSARATFNTSTQAGSTWSGGHRSTSTFTGNPFATSNMYFEIKITKTNAPGNLYLGVMLRARDVLT